MHWHKLDSVQVTKYFFTSSKILSACDPASSVPHLLSVGSEHDCGLRVGDALCIGSKLGPAIKTKHACFVLIAGPLRLERRTSVLETEILPLNYGPVRGTIPCKNAK